MFGLQATKVRVWKFAVSAFVFHHLSLPVSLDRMLCMGAGLVDLVGQAVTKSCWALDGGHAVVKWVLVLMIDTV